MYVTLWVEFRLLYESFFLRFCLCVCWLCLSFLCIFGKREIWCVFTPWPQTGVLKPFRQCAAFSLLSPPSIFYNHALHPRGHVLRHLHPGSLPPPSRPTHTHTLDACFLHLLLCFLFSQHAFRHTTNSHLIHHPLFATSSASFAVDPLFPPGFRCV